MATIAACSDDPTAPLVPAADAAASLMTAPGQLRAATDVTALSRNLYIGADVDAVINALLNGDPADDLPALVAAIGTLQLTAFPARAQAIAAEIDRTRPHVVGLQELSQIDISIPPLGVAIDLDFLQILQGALQARGLNYVVAAQVQNASVLLQPIPGSTISVLDFDALLVDARRVSFDPASVVARNFSVNVGEVAPGIEIIRGWVAVTVRIRGRSFTVASTHLESGSSNPGLAQIRAAQAGELVASLDPRMPAIVMGDMNDIPGSPMYEVLTGSGFADIWRETQQSSGLTCCSVPDLSNGATSGVFTQRLDYIFARGVLEFRGRLVATSEVLGEEIGDRIDGPAHKIWPSDHAGIVAGMHFPRSAVLRRCALGGASPGKACDRGGV
jgi:hypothetical protein